MKRTKILYWIFTVLFAFMMLSSAIPDVLSSPVAVKGMHEGLGYPLYFVPFIGVAKVLGVIAILVPGFSKIKEWAYAGLFFDLFGATYSIASIGAPAANWLFMALPIALAISSYVFYRKKLRIKLPSTVNYAHQSPGFFKDEKVKVAM
ncbi:MAG TPA: DoxX family protein [Chitinophagaceae bacterium]|jgi:DoxX-like protein|nr:DoxX family protein [Chitinophagaceae bacterium]